MSGGPRLRALKLPRAALPAPLANALRLYGWNWRGARSRNGKLWKIYPYGKPGPPQQTWDLHSDADPEQVIKWLVAKERGEDPPAGKLLAGDSTLAERIGL
jgi:hypothetical protein